MDKSTISTQRTGAQQFNFGQTQLPDHSQKKTLEKMYARIFDLSSNQHNKTKLPKLTTEGKQLCQQAKVDPDDLHIKTLEDFVNDMAENRSKSPIQPSHRRPNSIPAPGPSIFKGMNCLPSTMESPPQQIKVQRKKHADSLKEAQEVAKIKFEHHQVKRLRKLAILNNLVDKQALQKKLEKEKAE